jgi:hypothetical protein
MSATTLPPRSMPSILLGKYAMPNSPVSRRQDIADGASNQQRNDHPGQRGDDPVALVGRPDNPPAIPRGPVNGPLSPPANQAVTDSTCDILHRIRTADRLSGRFEFAAMKEAAN